MTGCWDNVDLIDINLVTALGIDKSEDGKIIVTVQVIEPAALQSTSSSQGKVGMAQTKPVFVESYKGETISDALISMKAMVDKRLFLSTVQVIILGEKLCREGVNEALDFLHRDYQVEYLADVLVARGCSPKDILKIQPEMDVIPAMYIKGTIENTELRAKVKRTMLVELFKDIENKCRQITIGQITKENEKTVNTEGTAVFKDGKLVGWLNQYETRGFLFVTDRVKNTIITIPMANGKMSIRVLNSRGKMDVKFKNGRPYRLSIYVDLEGNIAEYTGKKVLDAPTDMHTLQMTLSEEVKKEIAMALRKAQKEYSSDIFGFGKIVHKYHPQYWKQTMDQWNDIFSSLPTEIVIKSRIRRSGLIKSPMTKDE
nr:Ger(x)C family spore germination protein [Caldicoprobacter algeriensis]